MTKTIRFLSFCLLLLSINAAHAQEALNVYVEKQCIASLRLDKIQRITFSGDEMTVKQFDGVVTGFALNNIAKLTFGDVIITSIGAPTISNPLEVLVYSPSPGEIAVESSVAILRLTLFAIDGKMMYADAVGALRTTTQQTTVNVSAFQPGIYLLQIETQQGTVVKKFIKK